MVWQEELFITLKLVWERALEILKQPAINKEMLWILLPLIAALFLIEFYFARYKKEELGWNTAVSNALVLLFVGLNLCSFLYSSKAGQNMLVGFGPEVELVVLSVALKKSAIAYFIILESVFLLILNFFHLANKCFAFGISSGMILNFMGVMAIIFVYTPVSPKLNLFTLASIPAILTLFIIMAAFFAIVRALSQGVEEEVEE